MSKVIILGVKTYSFENEQKQKVEGAKISYLPSSKGTGINENGYSPLQSSVNLEVLQTFKDIPGLYNCNHEMVAGKGNKPTLKLIGFDFIKSVDLSELFK